MADKKPPGKDKAEQLFGGSGFDGDRPNANAGIVRDSALKDPDEKPLPPGKDPKKNPYFGKPRGGRRNRGPIQYAKPGEAGKGRPAASPAAQAAPGAEAPKRPLSEGDPTVQKEMLVSAFGHDAERDQRNRVMGTQEGATEAEALPELPEGTTYDGLTPAPEVTSRDLWRALNPPVRSREGARSAELYRLVLDQFAPGANPRYEEDGPGLSRAHIFIWDVTKAMGAEVPHFLGARELTLAQTCDWLRQEGFSQGWRRVDALQAIAAANAGQPVIAAAKEIKVKLLAMARPGEPGGDGKPKLSSAAGERGPSLSTYQALGVHAAEYFVHA
jgi:hypothetical protein